MSFLEKVALGIAQPENLKSKLNFFYSLRLTAVHELFDIEAR